jgi:hypothetical protein
MKIRLDWRRAVAMTAVLGFAACGSGSTPTTPPSPAPSIAPTAIPSASPSPVASPGASSCQYGKGTVGAYCDRQTGAFAADVDAAIMLLVQQHPEIFDLNQQAGEGGYKVLNPDAYYAGVIANLQARQFCAGYDFVELQVKNSNSFSEQYDIMLGSGHIRRGAGAYRATCSPANFPLDPEDLIDHVRVSFFGIGCIPGVTPPRNGERLLLMGCYGHVTASPKNKAGDDIDARIHGERIEWTLSQEDTIVQMDEFPGVAFNKTLTARHPGHFTLCATVKGVRGCLEGEVKDNDLP